MGAWVDPLSVRVIIQECVKRHGINKKRTSISSASLFHTDRPGGQQGFHLFVEECGIGANQNL
jgi:hypothetical protein